MALGGEAAGDSQRLWKAFLERLASLGSALGDSESPLARFQSSERLLLGGSGML